MKNLKQIFLEPLNNTGKKGTIFIFILALFGFLDATYLSIEHFMGRIPPCTLTQGCDTVLTSGYATIFGIPVALIGALYYLVILVGLFLYFDIKNKKILKAVLIFTLLGFIFSLYFIYIQIFILGSYCMYCLISAIISTIIFVTAMEILEKATKK